MIDDEERRVLTRLRDDFIHYAEHCLKLRTKSGNIVEFQLNKSQRYIHTALEEQKARTGKVRALVLKSRQQGCSTYVGARFYHQVTFGIGIQAFILTHALDATNNLYEMVKRYYEHTPDEVKPITSKSNAKALVFGESDSGYKLGTAENKRVGRSATIQLLHLSEAAFFNNAADHATGILQAVPNSHGEIIVESTANGVGGWYHQEWQKAESGESEYIAIFVPWFWQEEYARVVPDDFVISDEEEKLALAYGLNKDQLYWRRTKIIELSAGGMDGKKAFQQEYPSCATEAFILTGEDNFIPSDLIIDARKAQGVEAVGPLLIGCDPARFGQDRTAIIFRQGRVAYNFQTYIKKDTMETVGILHSLILEHKPARLFIDVGGLGAGIYDRLKELGHGDIIVSCNSGSTPLDQNKYRNKRAEMWAEMKAWLTDGPVSIPDDDELHADIANTKYKFDSNTRLLMEAKEDMKKRGVRSSDGADCLAQTFFLPDLAITMQKKEKQDRLLNKFAQNYQERKKILTKT